MNISDIRDLTAIALIGLFLIIVVRPLIQVFIDMVIIKTNHTKINNEVEKRIEKNLTEKFEGNHFSDTNRRLVNLEKKQDKFSGELEDIKIQIVLLKEKIK